MNRKVNILVVDDRPEGILAVEAVLTDPTYSIVPANSGNDALKALLSGEFAVILMDVQMPILNGFDTAQIIRTREKSRDIPIIFMSAINQDEQYVYQGYSVGAVDYIMKPFDPFVLKSKVAIFVDMYRKNKLIQEQAKKLYEAEVKTYAQALDKLEIKSLRRYQYLADAIPQVVFRLLPDGQYEYFNRVWFEYTGMSPTVASGHGWKEAVHSDDLPLLLNVFQSSTEERPQDIECRLRRHDGVWRWHLLRIEAERYEDPSEVKSWLGTATDIEERRREEDRERFLSRAGELLVSSLDFTKTLGELASLAVPQIADWCSFDALGDDGSLKVMASRHAQSDLTVPASALHQRYLEAGSTDFGSKKVFTTGIPEIQHDLSADFFEGIDLDQDTLEKLRSFRMRSLLIVPMRSQGRTVGTIIFASLRPGAYLDADVRFGLELGRRVALAYENFKLFSFSQQAIEIRNDFLSIASHELNTPITSLKLQLQTTKKSLELARSGELPLDRFRKSIDASCKQVDRLINLVQVLLDVSRIQSGKFTFRFQSVSLREMVDEVLERFREVIASNNCELSLSGVEDLRVIWDKTRIEQVMINLLTNAIKYAPGKITLGFERDDGKILLYVEDKGAGIPSEKLPAIFDRFERVGNQDSVSGLGLGLYIVKQIVEGHHGKVTVSSQEGQGTKFTVSLPLDASDQEPIPDEPSQSLSH